MTTTGPTTVAPAGAVAPVVTPALKPGYKTTEALIVVLVIVGQVVASAADWLPPRYASIGSTVAAAAYALSRGLAKLYPPKPSN